MFRIYIIQLMEQLSEIELRKGHNNRGKKLVKDIKYNVSITNCNVLLHFTG